jgi:N6-adenosine-specific RNA methylase IME4
MRFIPLCGFGVRPSRWLRRSKAHQRRQDAGTKIKVVYADPPWVKGLVRKPSGAAHYPTLTTAALCQMGVPLADVIDDNAVLLLWVTNHGLEDGLAVMKAWGFRYVTNAVWEKEFDGLGPGNYFRGAHELLLLGMKGRSTKPKFRGQSSIFHEPRQRHSRKPSEIIQKLERMFDGPYLELFARERPNTRGDWSVWGNEIDSDIVLAGFPVPSDALHEEVDDAA